MLIDDSDAEIRHVAILVASKMITAQGKNGQISRQCLTECRVVRFFTILVAHSVVRFSVGTVYSSTG